MNRDRIVVDASVVMALVVDEPDSAAIRAGVARWLEEGAELVVPDHFWLELVNPLGRRHGYDGQRLLEVVREIDELPVSTIPTSRPQLILAISLMERFDLTAYDAVYVALADTISAPIASTDTALLRAAGPSGLDPRTTDRQPPRRLSEEQAPYGTTAERDVTWPRWPGAGSYLATLRRRAMADAVVGRSGESPQRVAR
ncbi:MAG: type II toxin-antitoxin system VapC family toxin [Candidatus Limnocylindrales bacterium]